MRFRLDKEKRSRFLLPISAVLLATIGLVFIYSASFYSAKVHYDDTFFYVKKQAIAFAVALVFMWIGTRIDLNRIPKRKWLIYFASVVLLALVFVPGLGSESYGATRWLDLKIVSIQPSEIAKFGFVIFLACYMAANPQGKIKNLIVPVLSGGIVCGLIMAEPNMSVTVVVGLSLLVCLFIGGTNWKIMALMVVGVVCGGVVLIAIEPYRLERLSAFLDPWQNPLNEGYQLIQSYYALGSGGLFGVGLFQSRQKYLFLPFAESDFIFSVIGEETGLVGCGVIILLFLVYVLSGIRVAKNAESRYYTYLATGITSIVAIQAAINMAVVSGSIPPTGVPLPFVSFGGTSLVAFFFVTGLLYNVARNHSVCDDIVCTTAPQRRWVG